jgi:hypothetical protein
MPPKKNLKLSAVRLCRLSGFSQGDFLAAAGGEMRSDYLQNTAQNRTSVSFRKRKWRNHSGFVLPNGKTGKSGLCEFVFGFPNPKGGFFGNEAVRHAVTLWI